MFDLLLKLFAVIFGLAAGVVLTQDFQIFPGALRSLVAPEHVDPRQFDPRFERLSIKSDDGEILNV